MDKKLIPIYRIADGRPLKGISNPDVAHRLMQKKDFKGKNLYAEGEPKIPEKEKEKGKK